MFIFCISVFFSLPGTDNESLEQNFSDFLISFVWIYNHPHLFSSTHTHTNAHNRTTLENHHFGLTRLFEVTGKKTKKNVYRCLKCAWTCPGACSLTKSVHTPLLLVQLAQNALQCMQDCARGILFNDRLIYIYFNYKCTLDSKRCTVRNSQGLTDGCDQA